MTWNLLSACYLGIHPRDGIPRGFLTKSEVCAERERVSIVPLGGLGLRGVQLLKQRSLRFLGGGVGNKVSSPSWVWRDIVHLGMCVCVDACKFKWQGSG